MLQQKEILVVIGTNLLCEDFFIAIENSLHQFKYICNKF